MKVSILDEEPKSLAFLEAISLSFEKVTRTLLPTMAHSTGKDTFGSEGRVHRDRSSRAGSWWSGYIGRDSGTGSQWGYMAKTIIVCGGVKNESNFPFQ